MRNVIDHHHAQRAFDRSLRKGRRDTGVLSRLLGRDNRLLQLTDVLDIVTIGSETYLGAQDVRVDRVIGTESRGDDFSRGFHPTRRWMERRWMTMYGLMDRGELNEPISVIDVDGRLFVRDGHHRVSVARALDVEFLPAVVTRYEMPFGLPAEMDRNALPLLRAKERFNRNTGVFAVIDDGEFYVACPNTWGWLEKEICEFNRAWFIRRFEREPESLAEQVETWYDNLYHNAIEYIRRNSLAYLFPGKRETDIFVEMIKLWNSYDYPDGIWLGEIYQRFLARRRRQRLFQAPLQLLVSALGGLLRSPEDEYRQFLSISQVEDLVPDFHPLPKEKGFYRFLYRQLVHRYAPALKPEYGRAPYIQELTPRWHRELYAPVADRARTLPTPAEEVAFYRGFCRRFHREILSGATDVPTALRNYEAS